jgi:hypothetical protein
VTGGPHDFGEGAFMAEQELEISISREGKVTVRTKGLKGEACMKYANLLVEILGKEESREKTEEFYETQQQESQVRVQQRL